MRRSRHCLRAFTVLGLAVLACADPGDAPPDVAFWDDLRTLCGRAFEGTAVHVTPLDSAVVGERLVLNVWQCWSEEVRIAFHVGNDHSRVWLLRWEDDRLHLVHSIHTATGELADPSNYGGIATATGTAQRQTFVPDDDTLLRFPSARGSVWTLELVPRERLTYAFGPVGDADRFRLDFDLTQSVSRPPAPWGWTRVNAAGRPRTGIARPLSARASSRTHARMWAQNDDTLDSGSPARYPSGDNRRRGDLPHIAAT